ncbi:phosphate acyltransferase [bacterium BMS3Abin07]|nr:phosphate acyltransferase [bacterium BMS3Abin07]GBE32088.1 phosphate acyltransferase [bacterium BMS3Bbin05]HDL20142.1 phosphate acyltransferase PlsX [Nitrospirota bacterium]HDO22845.1 phosphate acyltransferase PlsX [Nitrospirota bacterium]HDZ88308.1 phosphate acyltransferase PlsX [Nitrospirota bacterium]
MIIALDAMGGDLAPDSTVEGAVETVTESDDIKVILVGDEHRIIALLKDKKYPGERISVQHASDVVPMHESPSVALRKRKDSSIAVAVSMVKSGNADAVVSAGHSGVTMAMSLIKIGKIKGVERPAIATIMPSLKDPFVLVDAGANVDCSPQNLLEFGVMGSAYCSALFDRSSPRVAILNIGEEDTKGNELTKAAFKLLKDSNINFTGNIEGKEVYAGETDVVVCDGFLGNITLKISEGLAEAIYKMLKNEISRRFSGILGFLLMKPALKDFKKKTNYAEYGGAPLLGINGTSIISHGRSSPMAIRNAIGVAAKLAGKKLHEIISIEINSKKRGD